MTKQKSTSNISTNIKEPSTNVEEKPKSFTKVNFTCTPNRKESQLEIKGANKEPNEADLIEETSVCKASTCEKPHDTTTQDQTSFSGEVKDKESGFPSSKYDSSRTILASDERTNKSTEKRVCIIDGQKDKKVPKTRSSLDAWKVKRNWEDVLSSPMKNLNRPSRSPCAGWRSAERVRVLHDKLMSPERKRKSPLEMKKEVDEKQARATRIRRELENERVQRLQKTTEKLNRVSEWQAVRSNKLREGMHARQQRGESRHEAHLAEIARRAGDESSKVSEVRFITSLNEENKKLSLRQKLQDSELRRAERLQIIKIKQKEDVAREEAVLERRKIIEAERLQRLAEAQRKKEEAKARRDEERKAASAAREARAVEQVRKKEVRAKAQQEVTELQAQKLMEKLRESELRRKCYLEQIRERAAMESREQCSPSTRLPSTKDIQPKITDGDSLTEKEISRQSCSNKSAPKMALQHQALKRKVKKIRQKLMAKKYDFMEPPVGAEGFGIGSIAIAAAAKSKIGRWLQDLQRFQLARKAGTSGVSFIVAEMIKYFDGKVAELHAARQAGLIDFIATAIPASHTSKAETSQTTLSLLRILKVLLALPANRSYFISRNLLPPLIPILSTALENFSSQDAVIITSNSANASSSNGVTEKLLSDEKVDAAGEVLNGLLECVILVINHRSIDERQASMQDDLIELLTACEVIHHLRDLFSLFDRPQNEGAPFPAPVLYGLNLLQALTASRDKALSLSCELQLSAILNRKEAQRTLGIDNKASVCSNILAITTEKQSECQVKSDNLALAENEMKTDVLPVEHLGKNSELTAEVPHTDLMQLESTKMEDCEATGIFTKGESDTKHRQESTQENSTGYGLELAYEKGQTRQQLLSGCHSINVLVSAIAETGLVGLPSLLTAVLLQTNPRSTPEQAASILPSNFEEIATVVLKVLNNLARLDLALVQSLLAMPDLQMEFFHLVSFLLSHCTCKWANPSDQVASLLLETLLLLGYFALLHPGNQAVLRWGKSPTILHKICDLPFAFFSDPSLMPALVGTLLSVCYGSEQNRDVVREELSMEMLLSLLKSSRTENLADKDIVVSEASSIPHSDETDSAPQNSSSDTINEEKTLSQNVCADDIIPAKEEIKRMIEDIVTSDGETGAGARQQPSVRSSCGKFSTIDSILSPTKRSNKTISKVPVTSEVELPLSKDLVGIKSRTACRGSTSSSTADNPSSQSRKVKANGPESLVRNGNANTVPVSNKRQPSLGPSENQLPLMDCPYASADASELDLCHRPDLMLQNRFPACLLDMAQDFFAAGL
ncbi:hypothetical protein KP509_05G003300 [Ceratopteris richardii]|nr:hypothetical protein KP509_05G003300 [Ceratopteris richardii]